jgi:hypothetical protein
MNDVLQIGDFAARLFWHFVVAALGLIQQLIIFVTQSGWQFLTQLLQDAANTCGLGNAIQPIQGTMLPYWNDCSLIVNWMASTFVGNGTLQLCLSIIINALAVALILRGVFTIYSKIPVAGRN